MKQKKIVILFLVLSVNIIIFLPLLNMTYLYQQNKFGISSFNKKQLFTTNNLESIRNYIMCNYFKISPLKGTVVVGKDGFLFLGNNYTNIINRTKGTFPYTQEDIDQWTDKLKSLQDWYESKNIKFVLTIVPNKHTIYNDKLPDSIRYAENETMTDDGVRKAKLKHINILNLKDSLRNKKKKNQIYYTTDSHWNNLGSSIGFKDTIRFFNSIYKEDLKIPKYNLTHSYAAAGGLSRLLKINHLLPDNYEDYFTFYFQNTYRICHGKINKKHTIEKCTTKDNLIMDINFQDQYMINNNSLNQEKLLLICDSFARANSKLYNATFNTIWKFHYAHINGNQLSDFINEHKPDIVIYQIAERDLYNIQIIKKISNIKRLKSIDKLNIGVKILDLNNHLSRSEAYINNQLTIKDKKLQATGNDPVMILNRLSTKADSVVLTYEVNSTMDTTLQLFYKKKSNTQYSEYNSYHLIINKGYNDIKLLIPAKYINNQLRVDPVSNIGTYEIKNFSIFEVD